MSKLRTFAIFSVGISLIIPNKAISGPFSNVNRLGDLLMVMAPAYALGMTVMEKDWDGTIQLAESIVAAQL